jgi:hypothetical protein
MYPSALIHLCLFVLGVINLYRHNVRKPGTLVQLAPIMSMLCAGCNICSALMYATGYNFDGEGYIPFTGWATYYFFEGGACTFWGIAITIVILFWLELCIIHRSTKFSIPDKMSFLTILRIPCGCFIVANVVLLVMLMLEVIGYHLWISIYLYYECFLFVMLLYSGSQILGVVRHLRGNSRPIALMTLWLAISLGSWITYDIVYVTIISDLNEVGHDGYIIAEGVQSVIWISSICFIDGIGSKGLAEPLKFGIEEFMIRIMTRAVVGAVSSAVHHSPPGECLSPEQMRLRNRSTIDYRKWGAELVAIESVTSSMESAYADDISHDRSRRASERNSGSAVQVASKHKEADIQEEDPNARLSHEFL